MCRATTPTAWQSLCSLSWTPQNGVKNVKRRMENPGFAGIGPVEVSTRKGDRGR